MENQVIERAFEWDDIIEKDGNEFILLPEGDYSFIVTKFERKRYTPGEHSKLPPCNQADLTITINTQEGQKVNIIHSLFLHSKCEGLLSAFFIGIGQKKHGEPLKMNWNSVIGARGQCKVGIKNYTKKDGTQGQSNEIKKFYEPNHSQVTPQQNFTPGAF